MIEANQQGASTMDRYAINERTIREARQGRRTVGRRAMGGQGRTGRPDRRYSVSLPAGGAKRTGRKAVPDFQSERKSRTVPVLRTVSRRSRFQGASGQRAFQDLYRRRSVAAARQTRTRAIRVTVRSAGKRADDLGPFCLICRGRGRRALKPRKLGESELAAVDMHAAELGAAVQGRKYLARVEQALGVERAFKPLLLVEIDLAEHFAHQVALLDADAMFAGQHAAEFDADPQDVVAEGFRPLDLAWSVGIVQDQWMQVAVAGMKHIGDAKVVFCR